MTLETELRDLALHLDAPRGDGIAAAVRRELVSGATAAPATSPRRRGRWAAALAAAAVVAVLAVAGTVALTDPFGQDRTEVGQRPAPTTPRETKPAPSTPTTIPPVLALGLDQARAAVQFPIRVPQGVEVPASVLVDRRVPGGLVALRYPAFTLVALSAPANASVTEVTSADAGSTTHPMVVRGQPALWITGGASEIGYLDRERALRRAQLRTGGSVLVWVEQGVTYRIEGFDYQSSAMAMANSMA